MSEYISIIPDPNSYIPALSHLEQLSGRSGVITSALHEILRKKPKIPYLYYPFSELPNNKNIINKKSLENAKLKVRKTSGMIFEYTEKPILYFIKDKCITNTRLKNILIRIFGINEYGKYIHELDVHYQKRPTIDFTQTLLSSHNSIKLIGGSWTNVYSIHRNWIDGKVGDFFINTLLSDYSDEDHNSFGIGICHGQNYFVLLLNKINSDSTTLMIPSSGAAHFGPSHLKIDKAAYDLLPKSIKDALKGITNNGKNFEITCVSTRVGKNEFDILKRKGTPPVRVLGKDLLTGDPVFRATNNSRVIGFHLHPEAPIISNTKEINEEINHSEFVHSMLTGFGPTINQIRQNYNNIGNHLKNEVGEAYYTFIILSQLERIYNNLKNKNKSFNLGENKNLNDYGFITGQILKANRERLDEILKLRQNSNFKLNLSDKQSTRNTLKDFDLAGVLKLNARYGRTVNRGVTKASHELGVTDLGQLINHIVSHVKEVDGQNGDVFIVRDMGCGTGAFLEDFDKTGRNRELNIVLQGIGKEVPFELEQGLANSKIAKKNNIPLDVLKLIKILITKNYDPNIQMSCYEQVGEILSNIVFNINLLEYDEESDNYYFDYVMPFYKSVFRPVVLKHEISKESYYYLIQNLDVIEDLLNDIVINLYDYFEGYVERIYISQFSDFAIEKNYLEKAAVHTSIKASSQISSAAYKQFVIDFINKFSRPGGVLIDNGLQASYTSIPRIQELYEISIDPRFKDKVKIQLLYDQSTNYFTTALVMIAPFINEKIIESYLIKNEKIEGMPDYILQDPTKLSKYYAKLDINTKPNIILIDVKEAAECYYTKFERFLRDYLLVNFKTYDVFWYNKKEIYELLLKLPDLIEKGEFDEIKLDIVNIVNKTVAELNKLMKKEGEKGFLFNGININILDTYHSLKTKQTFEQILIEIKKNLIIPEWLRPQMIRKLQ